MRYLMIIATFIIATSFGCNAQIDANAKAKVDALFSQWDKDGSPGVAIGVVQNGELIYAKGYGMANLDYQVPLTVDSKFYIASIAKQFTAACIALLSIEGKLDLEDDVRKYFPELPDYGKEITVENLVHHTSGLRDYLQLMSLSGRSFEDYFNNDDGVRIIARQKALNFNPNKEFLYSNSGYIMLAEIVRKVSGMSIREYADKKIFQPLKMTNSFFNDDHKQVTRNRVVSYQRRGGNKYQRFVQNFDGHGDGGMISTVRDLFLWDQNFYHKKVGGEEFVDLMLSCKTFSNGKENKYAFGLQHGTYKDLKIVVHGGSFLGFNHHFTRFPEQGFSVIVLSNLPEVNPYYITDKISDVFLESHYEAAENDVSLSEEEVEYIELPNEDLNKFCGNYWNYKDNYSRKIYLKNDTLRYFRGMGNESSIVPIGKNKFKMLVGGSVIVNFYENDENLAEILVTVNGDEDYIFTKFEEASYSAEELKKLEGTYFSEELNSNYQFKMEKDALLLYINGKRMSEITPIMANLFVNDDVGAMLFEGEGLERFSVGSGRVTGVGFVRL